MKIWDRSFTSIFIVNAFMNLGLQMVNGVLPKYVDSMGASASEIGLVTSLFAITALLFKIVSGPAIDSFNRKKVLAGFMAVMCVSFVGYGLSTSIAAVGAMSLLRGAAQAFTATCSLVIATDFLPQTRLGEGIGVFTLAFAACQAIGPAIGLYLAQAIGYRAVFLVDAGLEAVGVVLLILTVENKSKGGRPFRISLDRIIEKKALVSSFLIFLLSIANTSVLSFLIIFSTGTGIAPSQSGLYFLVYSSALLLIRPLLGSLADRHGFRKTMLPGLFLYAGSFALLSQATSLPFLLLAAGLSAFGYGASQPIIQAASMKATPFEKHGAVSCTCYIGMDMGAIAGPNIAGAEIELFGYTTMWLLMIIPIGIAIVAAIFLPETQKNCKP